jgi:hypothetical protein
VSAAGAGTDVTMTLPMKNDGVPAVKK